MPTVADLGDKLKAKYPGSYDHLDSTEVGLKLQRKYPGSYDQFSPAPAAHAPTPAGLAPEPPPGFLSNLAHSLINFTSPGPTSGPDLQAEMSRHPGVNPLNPLHALGDTASDVAGTFLHPLTALYQDPIGAANTLGAPIQMLTHPKPLAAVRAGGPDIAKGTAKLGAEYALHKMGPVSEILDLMGALKMGLPGVAQIGRGLRSGLDAARQAPWAVPDITDIFRRPAGTEPVVDPRAAIELVKDSAGDYVPKGPAAAGPAPASPVPTVRPATIPPVFGPGNIGGVEEFLRNRTLPDLPAETPSAAPTQVPPVTASHAIGLDWGPPPAHLSELPQGYKDLFLQQHHAGQIDAPSHAMAADAAHAEHLAREQGITKSAWTAASLAQKNAWLRESNLARVKAGKIHPKIAKTTGEPILPKWDTSDHSTRSLARIRELLPEEISPVE